MDAAQYLRKSRMEEGMDTGEVLTRHRQALADFAASHHIHIVETYCEVVSGESLYARPEMLRLLEDVEEGRYDAVLVMDLDRLSRGRMKDQGIILDAFRDSGTLIVTPEKTYDLSDDLDDEMAEFKTFMSRREYKIITKRLRRGLKQTIQDGCYVANAPYGYRKVTVDRKPTLEIYEPEAKFVRMMYDLYLQGYGCVSIARYVNSLGAKPHRSPEFTRNSVVHILKNPTFAGKIVWDQRTHIRKGTKGNPRHITIYNPRDQWTIVDGIHPAIVSQETYDQVQAILTGRYTPSRRDGTVRSALAGLVKCANCGQNMQRMTIKQEPYLLCTRPGCCASAKFELVEARVLTFLEEKLARLELEPQPGVSRNSAGPDIALEAVEKALDAARRQKDRLHELLETGVYDLPTFQARMAAVEEKCSGLERRRQEAMQALECTAAASPSEAEKFRTLLDAYHAAGPAGRNAILKGMISTIWYHKEKKSRPAEFQLTFACKPL